jgi:fused signal recognition particle receptor
MFDLLKSKITNFIKDIKNSVKSTVNGAGEEEAKKTVKASLESLETEKRQTLLETPLPQIEKEKMREEGMSVQLTERVKAPKKTVSEIPSKEHTPKVEAVETHERTTREGIKDEKIKMIKEKKERKEIQEKAQEKETQEKTKIIKIKPSLVTKLESFVSPSIAIKENDIKSAFDDLELQLIEADVALPVAQEIIVELKSRIIGQRVKYNELDAFVKQNIVDSMREIIRQEHFDFISFVRERISRGEKPVKILFVGPNGHGKTTTIAKIAYLLKKNNFSTVIAASDTFRAAAIEQIGEHGRCLNVPVIKHQYGSDPAAVAFDAIKYAESHSIDVVLIDTAGRQETSRNLIEQMKKIERVISPHLKIFVGEGIVGHAIIQQVSEFNDAIKIDGVILTKVDCDTKGGSVISIRKATGIPIFYLGVGQNYEDLVPFNEEYIISKLTSS